MAALPTDSQTVVAIYQHYERTRGQEPPRPYLGASIIGKTCARAIWYDFRWATTQSFEGRILRLFETGHMAEARFVADLRGIGCTVYDTDPTTGKQWSFVDHTCGGHLRGNADAIISGGLPEAPKSPCLVEMKTHSAKSFAHLAANGVAESKPQHMAQMQLYMHWTIQLFGEDGCRRALYIAVNKDTDALYSERLHYDKTLAEQLVEKARAIITAAEPPQRLSEDQTYYECKFCIHHAVCHGTEAPNVNCRTCAHATPDMERGNACWTCNCGTDNPLVTLPEQHQRHGCDKHRYIPVLLANFAKPVDCIDGNVTYQDRSGGTFINGDGGFSSKEIRSCQDKAALSSMLGDPWVADLRASLGAVVVG